jgi:hypothetical protein
MWTLLAYLTKPKLPKQYDGEIYRHLWHITICESLFYIGILITIMLWNS